MPLPFFSSTPFAATKILNSAATHPHPMQYGNFN